MTMLRKLAIALTLVAGLLIPRCGLAQSVPTIIDSNNGNGLQPYSSYGGTRENINLATGDLNLQIPLLSRPGRNGLDFNLGLNYDSKIWNLHGYLDPNSGQAVYYWDDIANPASGSSPSNLGWHYNIPLLYSSIVQVGVNPNGATLCYGNFVLVTSDGAKHPFSTAQIPGGNGVRAGCYCAGSA